MQKFKSKIQIESIDELEHTFVSIGCYRESSRLDRVLRTFQKAMTLAKAKKQHRKLQEAIASLHDHKGTLTVHWHHEAYRAGLAKYIERAWEDENEFSITHLDVLTGCKPRARRGEKYDAHLGCMNWPNCDMAGCGGD